MLFGSHFLRSLSLSLARLLFHSLAHSHSLWLGVLNDLASMEIPRALKWTEWCRTGKKERRAEKKDGMRGKSEHIHFLHLHAKHWNIEALEIPFYRAVGIKIIFMLTRNNSKQLSCNLLIMHTGTINFQIHNEFREWRESVVRWNMSLNIHTHTHTQTHRIVHTECEVWLFTGSISKFTYFSLMGKNYVISRSVSHSFSSNTLSAQQLCYRLPWIGSSDLLSLASFKM